MTDNPPRRGDAEFAGQVNSMFDRISGVYDRMNRVMTAGLDRTWRRKAVDRAEVGAGDRVLDLCCGTGDLAIEAASRVGPAGEVIGADFSEPMLEIAREKPPTEGHAAVTWVNADALDLPFPDHCFDAVTIGFGARNLADLDRGLNEMRRVLKPGGRLVILEITQPRRQPLKGFFALWFDRLVPLVGRVAGDSAAYTYLPDSVRTFPDADALADRLAAAGFDWVRWTVMAGGIIAIHSGVA